MARDLEACAKELERRFGADVLCALAPLDAVSPEHGSGPVRMTSPIHTSARAHATPLQHTTSPRGTPESSDGDGDGLLPEERAIVARAVPARRREFAAGRRSARELLARSGFDPAPLLRADDRTPLWPAGAIGSIAHHESLCAVAVARRGRLASVGLDVELDLPLEVELWSSICTARELARLPTGTLDARGRIVRLLFSAKECVYKCAYPVMQRVLEFGEVEIELSPSTKRFRAVIQNGAQASIVLEGFHLAYAGSILTGAALQSRGTWP